MGTLDPDWKAAAHVLLRKMEAVQRFSCGALKDLLPELESIETELNVGIDKLRHHRPITQIDDSRRGWTTDRLPTSTITLFSAKISVGPASVSVNPSKTLAHVSTVFDMNGLRVPPLCFRGLRLCHEQPAIGIRYYGDSHARVATTSASTPVLNVGWRTGANFGLWFTGSSFRRLACLAFA
jgi:hypothetical protein